MIKRLLLFLLIGLGSRQALAQRVPAWGGGADQNDLSFGFLFQYVSQDYKIIKNPDWRKPYYDNDVKRNVTDSLNSISSRGTPGFAVGFITRYRLSDHLEIRTTPALVFADRDLYYTFRPNTAISYPNTTADQPNVVERQVQTTSIDLPLSFKLKSDRIGDFRAYLLGGVKYTAAIGSKRNSDLNSAPVDKMVKNLSGFGSYEAGIGCDIYFEFFKLSPEIKLTNSFSNVLLHENQPYASPISKLLLHSVSLSLYFE